MDAFSTHSYDTLVKLERESYYEKKLKRWGGGGRGAHFLVVTGHSSGDFLEMLLLFFTPR